MIAAEDGDGPLYIFKPTNAQRARLFKVSTRSLAAARSLPRVERDKVKRGLRCLIEPKDPVKAAVRIISSDAGAIERVIIEIGLDRVLSTIDRLTAPALEAAE